MPRALITGITGFIGGHLARRLLRNGWVVDALVRATSDIASLPVADAVTLHRICDGQSLGSILSLAQPDVVFHLASLYLADHRADQVEELVRSNVLFPAMLAEAMISAGVTRLVNTGTAWQQFRSNTYLPVNLYAGTKQAAEDILLYYNDARSLSTVTLRLFDTYGQGDKRRKLIQILIEAVLTGETVQMSPGEQIIDLTHVDDIVDGFLLAADRMLAAPEPLRETYLLSGERYSIRGLAHLVGRVLGQMPNAQFGGRPYRVREVMHPVDVAPVNILPGWRPHKTLIDYIAEYIA